MSINLKSNTVKVVICFAVGLVCGTVTKALLTPAQSGQSTMASLGKNPAPASVPFEMNKHAAPLKVQIAKVENVPVTNEEEVQLTAVVTLMQPLADVQFAWAMPEGVQIVEGNVTDALPNMQAGQQAEVKIRVTGFSKMQQRVISLSASGKQGDQRLGNSDVVASRPEDTWEAAAPQMVEEAAEQLGEAAGRRRK